MIKPAELSFEEFVLSEEENIFSDPGSRCHGGVCKKLFLVLINQRIQYKSYKIKDE